ncbi:MAG: hypothetical protein WCR79_08200 [Fusobacterium sp.]
MEINLFLETVKRKFKDSFCRGICDGIIKMQNKKEIISNKGVCSNFQTIDDFEQDCVLYFLTNERYKKINNENGVRISIEGYLKNRYRLATPKPKDYYNKMMYLDDSEIDVLMRCGYDETYIKLHSVIYHNIGFRQLNLGNYFLKEGKINRLKRIQVLLLLLNKIEDITSDIKTFELYLYFIENKKNIKLNAKFYSKRNNGYLLKNDYSIINYLRDRYKEEVNNFFERNKLSSLCKKNKAN